MTSPFFCALVSLVMVVIGAAVQPQQASCQRGFHIEARWDRCDGCFDCRPNVPSDPHEPRGHEADRVYGPEWDGVIAGRIYCGSVLVADERTVRCAP